MGKLTFSIGICFVSFNLYEIHETVSDGKIILALQQDECTYGGNLIYSIRLHMNVEDRLAKKLFQCVAALFRKKT